jgi:hypothetical protein
LFGLLKRRRRSLEDIVEELAATILANHEDPSEEARIAACLLVHAAWNRTIGVEYDKTWYHFMLKKLLVENPELWQDLKSRDPEVLIALLIEYKMMKHPDDLREIRTVSVRLRDGKVSVR